MKRFLLILAITLMAIGQTISARDWTVSSSTSNAEAVFYVTLQDNTGKNVSLVNTNYVTLGAFVNGTCRAIGTVNTSQDISIFTFRFPVTTDDAGQTVEFALKVQDTNYPVQKTEYTLKAVDGSIITLKGTDQTVGYPSGSHKLLFTPPTGVQAKDGTLTMDVYDTVNLLKTLEFLPEGATVPDSISTEVGNNLLYMSVNECSLTAIKPSSHEMSIYVSFYSNIDKNSVSAEIPVNIYNPISSIALTDPSANSLTVNVNDGETASKMEALLTVKGRYVDADYTGEIHWSLKEGDIEGVQILEDGTYVEPVLPGTYILTANNEKGSLDGVDITLTVIRPATGLTALYESITVLQYSDLTDYLQHVYTIEPADATHGKESVTYYSREFTIDENGSMLANDLKTDAIVWIQHPDIAQDLEIKVTVVKGIPENKFPNLTIGSKKEDLETVNWAGGIEALFQYFRPEDLSQYKWTDFEWSTEQKSLVLIESPAEIYLKGFGTATLKGSRSVTACGFDDEGNFNATKEYSGYITFDLIIVQDLSGLSFDDFTIGCEDTYILTATTDPENYLLDEELIEYTIPNITVSGVETPLFSIERIEGSNSWKITPTYPGSGKFSIMYYSEISDTINVTVSQHFLLGDGWSWVAPYAGPMTLRNLSDEVAGSIQEIRSQSALTYNDPLYGFFGDLTIMGGTQTHKVNVKEGRTFDYVVDNADSYNGNETRISLQAGWNWIKNPYAKSHSFNEVFGEVSGLEAGASVVGFDEFTTYNDGSWTGSLQRINAGEGYLLYNPLLQTVYITLPAEINLEVLEPETETVSTLSLRRIARGNMPELTYNPRRFADNMSIIACMPEGVDTERYSVVPFVGEECRGEGKLVDGRYFITVHGQKNEKVMFRIYDNQTGEYENAYTEMSFSMMAGSIKEPVMLEASISGIEDITIGQSQDETDTVIYNMQGQRVRKDAKGLLIVNGKKTYVK